jgi:hypothetical protein
MSDPREATHVNPHPVSGHRTPREIAEDEAGPIGQPPDEDLGGKEASGKNAPPDSAGRGGPLAPGSRRPGERG